MSGEAAELGARSWGTLSEKEELYVRKIPDSRGRMKERKVSQEGKKNKRLWQHSEAERVAAWGKGWGGGGAGARKRIRAGGKMT